MKIRYLTKSRFKLALQCPTKLFYTGKNDYADHKIDDSFLAALAEGGFQVGALAKCYFPSGQEIMELDYDKALHNTNDLLKNNDVIIFEAAAEYNSFFIRVDILIKSGNAIEIIEVKSKSFNRDSDSFTTKNNTIQSDWREYICDIAFQKFVIKKAFPDYEVKAYLMLADKNAVCPTDGLNQKFRIKKNEKNRKHVITPSDITEEDLSTQILCKINVDDCCDIIYKELFQIVDQEYNFSEYIDTLADNYKQDIMITPKLSKSCGTCEFYTTKEKSERGLKSGYNECWQRVLGWGSEEFKETTVLDIWNYKRKDSLINQGRIKMTDVLESDISPTDDGKFGLSRTKRQWLQIQKVKNEDTTYWIDIDNLRKEMSSWVFPLHFIDFETSMVAIPFNKGRRPYEAIAFQFSHHVIEEDGRIRHQGEYINTTPGEFPNYSFIRRLKKELENDKGSIFRYAAHENTYLNHIYKQLSEDKQEIPDRSELKEFIVSITKSTGSSVEEWCGERCMIDMLELVKRYYYDPVTGGSNSIKAVLPAILNSSSFLQDKYSKPIYGASEGIPSKNYKDWVWIRKDGGKVIDPYKLLPTMFQDITKEEFELISEEDEIREGGAAMTAYARIQFEDMTDYERAEIKKALLKYCELDTFAMVMIYEGWLDFIK